jgi:hypothetical protein
LGTMHCETVVVMQRLLLGFDFSRHSRWLWKFVAIAECFGAIQMPFPSHFASCKHRFWQGLTTSSEKHQMMFLPSSPFSRELACMSLAPSKLYADWALTGLSAVCGQPNTSGNDLGLLIFSPGLKKTLYLEGWYCSPLARKITKSSDSLPKNVWAKSLWSLRALKPNFMEKFFRATSTGPLHERSS